jgi:hypothetical protein
VIHPLKAAVEGFRPMRLAITLTPSILRGLALHL